MLRFDGRVAIVTGAGNGLGKAYALAFASRGAKVVVNDLGGSFQGEGSSSRAADLVVEEIKKNGGEAVANYDSVENGASIVETAMRAFGRVDIVVNNAGILRDKSFIKMTDKDWDLVYRVHLRGAYAVSRAAWPIMREQNFGRIIFISSASGLYGNFGQSNYSAAKLGAVGLALSLAKEGQSKNILCNVVCPIAGSRMTETVMPPDMVAALKPEYVAPLILLLTHEKASHNGQVWEVGAGWVANVRWQRNQGLMVPKTEAAVPEAYLAQFEKLNDWTKVSYPTSADLSILSNVSEQSLKPPTAKKVAKSANVDPEVALGAVLPDSSRTFTQKDCILYALGVGAGAEKPTCPSELRFTYENNAEFSMLPTMGVTFVDLMNFSALPGLTFNPMMLLHGEHYLEVLNHPVPTSGTFVSKSKIAELWDKEKAALVVIESITSDAATGRPHFRNRMSAFIRGIGGWGGERGPKPESFAPPQRAPDAVRKETTTKNQALLYRIPSGDANPLHADPQMSAMGGFETPILHGLCTFGFAARAVLKQFANNDATRFKAINVRFAGHVFPGETIETSMWKVSDTRIIFETKVVERGTVAIANAMVELFPAAKL